MLIVAERRWIKNWSYPFLLRFIESEWIANCIAAKSTEIVYTADIYAGTRRVFCGTWFIKYLKKEIPALSIPARYSKLNDFNQSLRVPFHVAFYDFCENGECLCKKVKLFVLFSLFFRKRENKIYRVSIKIFVDFISLPTRYQVYLLVCRLFSNTPKHASTP